MSEKNNTVQKKIYDVADIQEMLGISRTQAYSFIEKVYNEKSPFPVRRIGRLYKIPKNSFDRWFDGYE